ncbi:hypothetical protein SAMN05443545_105280 [Aidingimonas halophila]|uniref:Uncharacterized protein n=1 Tax=Aidingimonas halophila TaxID=574349 RepID=A0A1H3BQX0_9GAMM|nr:hypothetical protein SAMN05443545_105280 [Aidingimonas halophila]
MSPDIGEHTPYCYDVTIRRLQIVVLYGFLQWIR